MSAGKLYLCTLYLKSGAQIQIRVSELAYRTSGSGPGLSEMTWSGAPNDKFPATLDTISVEEVCAITSEPCE